MCLARVIEDLLHLIKQPWFYQSPNPLTLFFWAFMAWYGSKQLLSRGVTFKKYSRFLRFLHALFIAGFVVMIQDLYFLVITTVRWIPIYPQYATSDFWLCFPRDLCALALLFLLEGRYYGTFTLNRKTWLSFAVLWIYTSFIFFLTPTMGITNWTYAITEGMPDSTILLAFSLNFLVGKPFLYLIYTTMWNPPLEASSITVNNGVH